MNESIIKTNNVKIYFPIHGGFFGKVTNTIKAVDGVSIDIKRGQFVSLVGESGSGKSTLGQGLLGLVPIIDGKLLFKGREIDNNKSLARSHRRDFQIIYQDFFSSLNPRNTLLEIISKPSIAHDLCHRKEIKKRALHLLKEVGLEEEHLDRYPHAFSGGQRQRINIARALAVEPEFLICDEIVSALDVSIQAQIIKLIKRLQMSKALTLLFITHDLAIVKQISDYVYVMHQGKIVEAGECKSLFKNPQHPYTKELIDSSPSTDIQKRKRKNILR